MNKLTLPFSRIRSGVGGLLAVFCLMAPLAAMERLAADAEELTEAMAAAVPGDRIVMAAGEWRDLDLVLRFAGEPGRPVTVAAAEPGQTTLVGAVRLVLEGSHGVISGLSFAGAAATLGTDAMVQIGGGDRSSFDLRITDCDFSRCNPPDPATRYMWIRLYGRHHRVDHCRFSGQTHSGVTVQVMVKEADPSHRIDHNLFIDRAPGKGNGFEMIQIGQSGDSMKRGGCTVDRNWFVRCDGETEIVSSKTDGNQICGNLFLDSSGTVTLRHGNRSLVDSNFFIGRSKAGSGGVRVIGEGHQVRRNYFGGLTGRTGGVVVLYCGIPDSPLNGYFKADRALVDANLFDDNLGNGIYLNGGFGGNGRTLLPGGVVVRGNFFRTGAGGVVAIAGGLRDTVLSDNRYASGVDTGVTAPEGTIAWEGLDPEAGASGPWTYLPGILLGPTDGWPTGPEVGPDWLLPWPELTLMENARLVDLARGRGQEAVGIRDALLARAGSVLADGTVYTVTDNQNVRSGGDPRDYYSTGPYWWPDPSTPDGLPYIRIDGKFNPERDLVSDREPLHRMIEDTWLMALAYAVTGDERFAEWGHRILTVWFLDPEKGMTPHLRRAQAIPGRNEGRGTGIIDTHPFAELADAICLLEASPGFPAEDAVALRAWFTRYLNWLLTSANGRDEADSLNNHGTAYDLQVASLMSFLGREDELGLYLEEVVRPRIDQQIEADGAQPKELARTRTWSYSTENLEHFFKLGLIGRKVGVDLFDYESPEGGSLYGALDFVLPAVCEPDRWTFPQKTEWQDAFINVVLSIAESVYDDPALSVARACLGEATNHLEAFVMRPEWRGIRRPCPGSVAGW